MAGAPPTEPSSRFVVGFLALARKLNRGATPPELQLLGRTLLHSALVGVAAGLVGSALYAALELTERLVLEGLTGYEALRAGGEEIIASSERPDFRPWLLAIVPALADLLGAL